MPSYRESTFKYALSANRGYGRTVELAAIRIILVNRANAIKVDFRISAAARGEGPRI